MSIKEQAALAKKAAQASRRANPELYPTYLDLCAARAALAEAKDRHDRLRRRWAEECGRPKSPRAPKPPECGGEGKEPLGHAVLTIAPRPECGGEGKEQR